MEKTLSATPNDHVQNVKPVVLLVDDNQDLLDFISDDLSDNYDVLTAKNGVEALELISNQSVQLVISDIMMPKMDGFEFCKRIKSTIESSHIPVILLTAKNTLQSKIEGLELGADAYVEKPFSPEFLQVQVSSLIRNRNKIKEYFASSPLVHVKTNACSKADEQFLGKLQDTILKNLDNLNLDVDLIAYNLNISRPTLYRKIKSISNLSPNDLINLTRLKRAAELLSEGNLRIYEISERVGYSSQTHFGRNFLKQFGMSPKEYLTHK